MPWSLSISWLPRTYTDFLHSHLPHVHRIHALVVAVLKGGTLRSSGRRPFKE
jgi:hypothetical protein